MTARPEPEIMRPTVHDLDALVRMWTDLVTGQRAFGTRLRGEDNRTVAREWFARALVMDGVRAGSLDDRLIGFVTFEMEMDQFVRDVQTGIVHNLYVEREFREFGIGTTLLACAEECLENRGADRIRLEVLATNERACEFYEERGYRPHRVRYLKPGGETDNDNFLDSK